MISIHKVIFPGIAAGCLFLVFVVSMIANPTVALAAGSGTRYQSDVINSNEQPQPAAAAGAAAGAGAKAGAKASAEEKAGEEQAEPAQSESEGEACSLSQSYPDAVQQWCRLIEQYAGNNSLDPNLLAAVMLQESGGNPQAYSKSGAVGLLQVMPRDGLASSFTCINGPCFASRPSSQELFDPEFNISYGSNMLAGLIQRHGDVREALRAYGPMNMGYRYADIVLSIMERNR